MENNNDKLLMHERMAVVETQLRDIAENHLPHIYKRINWILGLLITMLISTIGFAVAIIVLLLK